MATNNAGLSSSYSSASTSAVYIVTVPHKPSSAPTRDETVSTKNLLQINMATVTGTSTGGLTITAYSLEWNSGGSGDTYTSLYEGTNNYYQFAVTSGTQYKFRYRVKNDLGYSSDYSDVLNTYAAIVPS